MIDIDSLPNGRLGVRQNTVPPTVYLDTWAWRRFSEDSELGDRLVKAIASKRGTVALSFLSLSEFSLMTDMRHSLPVERLIAALWPHLFFIEPLFFTVIAYEDQESLAPLAFAPHGDRLMLSSVMQFLVERGADATGLVGGVISESGRLGPQLMGMCDAVIEGIRRLKMRLETEPELRKVANRIFEGSDRPRATHAVLRACMGPLHDDKSVRFSRSDAIDLLHTIVPAAYCDFVLLDRRWAGTVIQATARIRKAGIKAPIASVYSEKNNGVARFLDALEGFRK